MESTAFSTYIPMEELVAARPKRVEEGGEEGDGGLEEEELGEEFDEEGLDEIAEEEEEMENY
jgi:hypothetical protein